MDLLIELIIILILYGILIWLGVAFLHYRLKIIKISNINSNNFTKVKSNLIIGISSGVIVLVMDRALTLLSSNSQKLDFSTALSVFSSIHNGLYSIILTIEIILFTVVLMIYSSIKHLEKKKMQ